MSDEIFRWVIAGGVLTAALCMVLQAVGVLVLLRRVGHIERKITPLAEDAGPILKNVRTSVEDLAPKLKAISEDSVEIVKNAREQVIKTGELLKDFTERAKAQVARIDGAVDNTVENVQHAGESVRSAVLKPVREVNGVLSGIKTAISVIAQGRRQSVDHATQDEEMFI
jgi:hypothetical protein